MLRYTSAGAGCDANCAALPAVSLVSPTSSTKPSSSTRTTTASAILPVRSTLSAASPTVGPASMPSSASSASLPTCLGSGRSAWTSAPASGSLKSHADVDNSRWPMELFSASTPAVAQHGASASAGSGVVPKKEPLPLPSSTVCWVGGRARGSCAGLGFSLYIQCAAAPYSAMSCMERVRICTSRGAPSGPTTAVCRLWYPVTLALTM
mmetsp:Transcript_22879/g.43747  ORF Transcript_22879/g.43747 Transcript_22879/m.43747 type:complete len:208 (+) Transcript_22879:832-1455(+)